MPTPPSISEQLARQAVVPMHPTIPPNMTLAQWRRLRSSRPRTKRRSSTRRPPAALPATSCGHLHDSTTRYDHDQKLLTFLLVCPLCATERVMEAQHYEPRYEPSRAPDVTDARATIQELPVRRDELPLRPAA
jgi:hypothetical protein